MGLLKGKSDSIMSTVIRCDTLDKLALNIHKMRIYISLVQTKCIFLLIIKLVLNYLNVSKSYEPRYEKNGLRGFRQGPKQTGLYSLKRRLEA